MLMVYHLLAKAMKQMFSFLVATVTSKPLACIDEYVQDISLFASGYSQWHYGGSVVLHEAES